MANLINILEALMQVSMATMIGIYCIFSNTIIDALKRRESGPEIMVEINKVILNPLFMAFFFGSALSSVFFFVYKDGASALAGLVFFLGTFVVTVLKNVPMNNRLRDCRTSEDRMEVWLTYQNQWLYWNHVRSISGLVAGFLMYL